MMLDTPLHYNCTAYLYWQSPEFGWAFVPVAACFITASQLPCEMIK